MTSFNIANILVLQENDGSFCLKIADFGLGRRFEHVVQNYTPGTQTMLYRAPEVFLNVSKVFHVIDIWSVGCIFAGMTFFIRNASRRAPFPWTTRIRTARLYISVY